MRILYVSSDAGVPVHGGKGASVHLRSMVQALTDLGHDVTVCSPRVEPGDNELPTGARAVELPAARPAAFETAEELRAAARHQTEVLGGIARERRAEGVYERHSLAAVAGARVAQELGIPLALEVNAPLREEEARYRRPRHAEAVLAAEREVLAVAAFIVAVSEPVARWLVDAGADADRVRVMPNAPPPRSFPPPRAPDPSQDLVVGFSGGLKPWHGVDTLLTATEQALSGGARLRLEILGTGPMEGAVAASVIPDQRLRRLGALPHDAALETLERWHVGVAPFTRVEGFWFSPLKLFEYMAAGLCPVVSDVGDLSATVLGGRAGVVVPPDDPAALAAALIDLDSDRDRALRLAQAAQQAARALPGWHEHARVVVEAITAGIRP